MSIQELIANAGERLTQTDRRIAAAILDDPTLLAFGTVSDLAERMGTSRPTIVRFANKLGFGGYTDLQRRAREAVARQLATPSHRIRQQREGHGAARRDIESAMHQAIEHLEPDRVRAVAEPIARARAVWIVSGETSRAGALVLQSSLSMIRDNAKIVQEHDLGRDLNAVKEGDAAVAFDFARYRRAALTSAEALVGLGVELFSITDGPLSPLVPLSKAWCELKVPAVGPFDSAVPAVLAAELIVLEAVNTLGPKVHERIDRLEKLWTATNTFV